MSRTYFFNVSRLAGCFVSDKTKNSALCYHLFVLASYPILLKIKKRHHMKAFYYHSLFYDLYHLALIGVVAYYNDSFSFFFSWVFSKCIFDVWHIFFVKNGITCPSPPQPRGILPRLKGCVHT